MEKGREGRGGKGSIPPKLYFRIGEVSDLVEVKPYVLRYWESEFPDIKPTKSKSGQRLYKRKDVEMLVRIKGLLYDERFTINGARKRLKDMTKGDARDRAPEQEAAAAEIPCQMDAFAEEPLEGKGGDVAKAPREGSKVLVKIRRDLESLLEMIRSE